MSTEVQGNTAVIATPDISFGGVPTIGENIKALRVAAGFKTQLAFAAELGVPQARVSDWERSRYDSPDVSSLMLLAKTLNVRIDEFLAGVDPAYDDLRGRLELPEGAVSELPTTFEPGNSVERQAPPAGASVHGTGSTTRDTYAQYYRDALAAAADTLEEHARIIRAALEVRTETDRTRRPVT